MVLRFRYLWCFSHTEIHTVWPTHGVMSYQKQEFLLIIIALCLLHGYPDSMNQGINSVYAEAVFMPQGDRSDWYAVALYNKVDSDLDGDDYESVTGHLGYVLRTNIRLFIEGTYDIEAEESRVMTGFVTAF